MKIESCQNQCHYVESIKKDIKSYNLLNEMGFPKEITENLYLFTIPSCKNQLYKNHYDILEEENPYRRLNFSYDDWVIAYIAAENKWSVISYDHHLLYEINQFLEFDCIIPLDLEKNISISMVLIDTNFFLHYLEQDFEYKDKIASFFINHTKKTFMVSQNILKELNKVYSNKNRLKKVKLNDNSIKKKNLTLQFNFSDPKEEDLHYFIDDFSQFESRKAKKKRKLKTKVNNIKSNIHPHNRWNLNY